jgi:hypothetical protein
VTESDATILEFLQRLANASAPSSAVAAALAGMRTSMSEIWVAEMSAAWTRITAPPERGP